ncbi:MAG: hemin uptake protein HemP [Rhodocyclaceae bacterium]|jgi:hemin uptake protein HemP|nr:hemin uptake protein HemP [Rhodocyclaceae bacterium]
MNTAQSAVAGIAVETETPPLQERLGTHPSLRPTLDSRAILAGSAEAVIVHHGETYRLRETRQGKLILTK